MEKNKKNEAEQLKELFNHFLSKWPYFVISFIICAIIGGIYYKAAPRIMGINATVNLRHDESLKGTGSLSQANSIMSSFGLGGGSSTNVMDEAIKMNSQGHIRQVVKNLGLNTVYGTDKYFGTVGYNLYDQSPIILETEAIVADTINQVVRFAVEITDQKTKIKMKAGKQSVGSFETSTFPYTIETAWGKYTFKKSENGNAMPKSMKMKILFSNYDYMTQEYRKRLTIDAEKKTSDIIYLSTNSDNIYLAKDILSEVIEVYNKIYDEDRDLVTKKTLDFLDMRLKETEESLENVDVKISNFKSKHNLTAISIDVTYYFTLAGEIQGQLLTAESQLHIIKLMTDFVSNDKNKYSLVPYLITSGDPSLAAIITAYNEQITEWNEAKRSQAQSPMTSPLEDRIELQRKNLILTLNNAQKAAEEVLKALRAKEKEFDTKLGNMPSIEKGYAALLREQEIQQTLSVILLEMKEQVSVKGVGLLPKLQIVDSPYVINDRLSPSIVRYGVMIVLIGGIIIPIALIYGIPFIGMVFRKRKE